MKRKCCEKCGCQVGSNDNYCEKCGIKFVHKKNSNLSFLSKKRTRVACGIIGIISLFLSGYQGWSRVQNMPANNMQTKVIPPDISDENEAQVDSVSVGENFDSSIGVITERDAIETVKKVIYGGKEGYIYEVNPLGYFAFQVRVYKNGEGLIGDFMFDKETFEISAMDYGDEKVGE